LFQSLPFNANVGHAVEVPDEINELSNLIGSCPEHIYLSLAFASSVVDLACMILIIKG
jgi:hypothetical protein